MSDVEPTPSPDRWAVLRILDANRNRAGEGLRVLEDYARFALDDQAISANYKHLRHELVAALAQIPANDLLRARDTSHDVGTATETAAEYDRPDALAVVEANAKRVEQSLRVLEEFGKVISPALGRAVERIRYQAYTAAKQLLGNERPLQLAAAQLYVLVDGGSDLDTCVGLVARLVEAGVDIVQLRDKRLADRELLARARAIRAVTRGKTLLIINDRADLAALCDADGVHVGQDELTVKDARSIVGPRRLVGVSTHSIDQARAAARDGADYLGCGPTFPSSTKSFDQFAGLALLEQVAQEIRLPAFAIGGINGENIAQVAAAGIHRAAVSGAICHAKDPAAAVRELRERLPPLTTSPPATHE